jgi:poly(A) polymerase
MSGGQIHQDWMQAEALCAVFDALTRDGQEVRFVGGCVRDSLAGRPVKEIDLATPDPPEVVMEKLAKAGLKAVPTGIAHGTVTAVSGGEAFEVTTLRRDLETDGRHAKVGFTDDWLVDASRRDLTINAMSLRPDGTLFDPFGGEEDLAAGRVRFVGKAEQRIAEDHLRLLRFFRFYAFYGRGELDPEARAAAQVMAPKLQELSVERVRDEFLRILAAPDPLGVLRVMTEVGALAEALPEAVGLERLHEVLALEGKFKVSPEGLLRLAALIDWDDDGVTAVARRLKLSNAQREWLECVTALAQELEKHPLEAPSGLEVPLHRKGPETVAAALLLHWAAGAAAGKLPPAATTAALRAKIATWRDRPFPLRGRDIVAEGVPRGPEVGRLLALLEDWWLAEGRAPNHQACLAKLQDILASAS